LAEWCTCVTSCVTMGDRFRGGSGHFSSVGVRDGALTSDDGTWSQLAAEGIRNKRHTE
jgi:hypothetical protein